MVSAGVGALLIIGTFKRRAPDPDFKVNIHVLPPLFITIQILFYIHMNMDDEISYYIHYGVYHVMLENGTYKTRWLNHNMGVCYKEKENEKMKIIKII